MPPCYTFVAWWNIKTFFRFGKEKLLYKGEVVSGGWVANLLPMLVMKVNSTSSLVLQSWNTSQVAAKVMVVPHRCTATKPRSIQANAFHMWSGRIRRETWVSSRPRARHVPPLNTFLAAAIAINWIHICDKYWREKTLDYLHVLLLISLPPVRSDCWRSLSEPMFKKGETAISISGASAVFWKHN